MNWERKRNIYSEIKMLMHICSEKIANVYSVYKLVDDFINYDIIYSFRDFFNIIYKYEECILGNLKILWIWLRANYKLYYTCYNNFVLFIRFSVS